jgi:hypothetical protein
MRCVCLVPDPALVQVHFPPAVTTRVYMISPVADGHTCERWRMGLMQNGYRPENTPRITLHFSSVVHERHYQGRDFIA